MRIWKRLAGVTGAEHPHDRADKIATAGRGAAVAMEDQSVVKHTMISETDPFKVYIDPYGEPLRRAYILIGIVRGNL